MARKDVELVIRAKDEAAKAVNAVTTAINKLVDSQSDLKKAAGQSDTALGRLGSALGELDKNLRSAASGSRIAETLDRASKASGRLETALAGTVKELSTLEQKTREAGAATEKLKAQASAAAIAVDKETAALSKAKAAVSEQASAIRKATTDRQRLIDAEVKLGAQIAAQQAKVSAAAARYEQLGAQIAKTAAPAKSLTDNFMKSGEAVGKQQAALSELQVTLSVVRAALDQTSTTISRLNGETAKVSATVKKQESALAGAKTQYIELQAAARTAAQTQKALAQSSEQAAASIESQKAALDRAQSELGQLSVMAGKADVALAELSSGAIGILEKSLGEMRAAARLTRAEFTTLSKETADLSAAMGIIGPPTREQVVALGRLTVAMNAAEAGYATQISALAKLSAILRETGGDVDVVRERIARFGSIQGQVATELGRIATEAKRSDAAYDQLAVSADRAGKAVRQVGGAGSTPPSAPINSLAEAWRKVYGESRQALSITQSLRGEVLSLIAAYGGLYGVINVLGQVVSAYQTLEAAQSRLNAVFQDNPGQSAKELDFIRRNADRLGISFGQLADEYTKFAASTKGTSLEGEKTRKIFISVAEAARVNKLSFEDLQGVFRALTQIASKGRLQLEELSGQLGDRLPGALQIMADGLGITTAELLKMTKAGEVTAEGLVSFGEELDRRFGPALAKSLTTTTTALGEMKNAAFQTLLTFAKAGFIESFTALLRDMTKVMQTADFRTFVTNLSSGVALLVDAIGVLVKNFQLVTAAASGFVAIKLVPFILATWKEFGNLRKAFAATATVITAANTQIAASTTVAGAATVAFGRLRLALLSITASTGIGLIVTAIAVGIGYWATEADKATGALVSHEKTVDQVKNAYDKAGGSATVFAKALEKISAAKIRADLVDLNKALADIAKPKKIIIGSGADFPIFEKINKATEDFNKGRTTLEEYRKALDELAASGGANQEWVDNLVRENLALAEAVQGVRDDIAEGNATLALQKDATDVAAKAVLGLADAMIGGGNAAIEGDKKLKTYIESINKLKEFVPQLAEELKKLKELAAIDKAFKSAIDSAITIGQANQAFAARDAAISAVSSTDYTEATKALSSFTSGLEAAAALVRRQEGFISTPKMDTDGKLRIGFGSDTVTLSDGSIRKVVDGMRISITDANRDLIRRTAEFQQGIKDKIGADRFGAMSAPEQAALTSIAYNYGSLPDRIVKAILSGADIPAAIRNLGGDNNGTNRNRRNEEAAIFASGGSQEVIDAQIKAQEEADKKSLEIAQKKTEEAAKFHEQQQANIEQAQFELSVEQQGILQKEIAKALREAELAAKAKGTALTEAERQKIVEVTTAKYQQAAAEESVNAKKKAAADAEQRVNDLLTQQKELLAQLAIYREQGDAAKITETQTALDSVNAALQEAITNAQEMWTAVGGGGADAAISKLKTAALEGKSLAASGRQTVIDWSQVAQMFASGLTNAIDRFAQAVANGEDVGVAAREAFLQFAADFLKQIAQMILQQTILNILRSFGLGGGGGIGAGLFHTGGVVGRGGNQRRVVDPGIFANATRYHDGGIPGLKPGEVPAILKKNEEVLAEDNPRNILNGGGATRGGTTSAGVNVKSVNVFNAEDMLERALRTRVGEQIFLNYVRDNPSAFKAALEGRG